MASTILLLLLAAIGYGVYRYVTALAGNVAKAKRTGLPYHVVPISPHSPIAQMFPFWKTLFKLLPRRYWEDVMPVLMPDWHFRDNYRVFEKLGDVFLVACPNTIILYTANAEVIHQVTSKREAFPKPVQVYKILSLYGESVLTTEGHVWKNHRKVTAASFNEKNAALVFAESIKQTEGMCDQWLGADGGGNKTIKTVEHDTMSLMLHIIGYVGFGLRLLWPGQTLPPDADARQAKYATLKPPGGHTLTFKHSLETTLEKILMLLLTPRWLLKHLPFKTTKDAAEAEDNFVKYLDEFLHDKIDDVKNGDKEVGMDIMGQLVRTSYGEGQVGNEKKGSKLPKLTDKEITGNAFIMIVAGHETTANCIHFMLLELANNPAAQRLFTAGHCQHFRRHGSALVGLRVERQYANGVYGWRLHERDAADDAACRRHPEGGGQQRPSYRPGRREILPAEGHARWSGGDRGPSQPALLAFQAEQGRGWRRERPPRLRARAMVPEGDRLGHRRNYRISSRGRGYGKLRRVRGPRHERAALPTRARVLHPLLGRSAVVPGPAPRASRAHLGPQRHLPEVQPRARGGRVGERCRSGAHGPETARRGLPEGAGSVAESHRQREQHPDAKAARRQICAHQAGAEGAGTVCGLDGFIMR
ncbi:cytochrome P450 [Apiospora arundinis]